MKKDLYQPCHLHENQYLQIVCQQCSELSLACPVCIDEYHAGHSMISLKKFISCEIPKLYSAKPNDKKINKGIQLIRQQFLQGFQVMRRRIGSEINQIQQLYNLQADRMKQQISVICGQGGYNIENITAIKKKLKQKMKVRQDEQLEKDFQEIANQIKFLLHETTDFVCRTIKQLHQYWQISCGIILNSKKKAKHHFSQTNKHQLIELKASCKNSKQQGDQNEHNIAVNTTFDGKYKLKINSGKYHIAVVEPPLNPFKNEISFRIQESANNCAWIGVCDIEKVKEKNFENCYKKNQGCYWIWQSGREEQLQECQFFSSLLEQSVGLDYIIKVGDIICVKLDYCTGQMNKISFFAIQEGKQNIRRLIYEADIEKKQFYACVSLGDQFQKISICI